MGNLGKSDYLTYYNEKLEQALIFQDFVMEKLHEQGITIMNYGSKKYQHEKGENLAGIEIKNDTKFTETGNLYIETEEKANPLNKNYIKSGIYRNDNTWLYIIGDFDLFFIFGKNILILLHKSDKYRPVTTPTSKGFLLPICESEKYCLKKINTITP